MFPSASVSFNVRSSKHLYGFVIDVVSDDDEVTQTYYLHQKYNRVDDSPDSCWTLMPKDGHHYDEPLLTGRLVYGRTDPFSPLMKCLQFLNKQNGETLE
jgi:hypothetical protein